MKIFFYISLILSAWIFSCQRQKAINNLNFQNLQVDYLEKPLALDNPDPRFSWMVNDSGFNNYQTAYQILVSDDEALLTKNDGNLWNSGRIESRQSVQIPYDGASLESGKRYFWKVRILDRDGNASGYSDSEWFEMGKLSNNDWQAHWISQVGDAPGMPEVKPAPYFRKEFEIEGTLKSARLYISGLGYYKAFLNGNRIGDHELDPAFTRYDRRVKYVKYDVSQLLSGGNNCLGVVLGNGWYNQHTRSAWDLDSATWRDDPGLLLQLELTFDDGRQEVIVSDDSWKVGNGPIVFDGIRNGEHYDARKEIPGWNSVSFDDRDWMHAKIVEGPKGILSAQLMPPIRKIRELSPAKITEPVEDVYVVHFNQNIAGRLRFTLQQDSGVEIAIRYGERLNSDGTLDQKELARFIWTGETQTDRYIFKGDGKESWESGFVYHGFQFVEITGLKEKPDTEDLAAVILHTDLESAGGFSCSNEMFNRLQKCTLNSFLGNYHGYPTDCPHREKIGWSGDAQLVSATALYNFRMIPSYLKWIDDFADEQRRDGKVPAIIPTGGWGYTHGRGPEREHGYGPHWEGAYLNIPWDMFMFTGDTSILQRYYDGFHDYMTYLEQSAEEFMLNYGIDDHKQLSTITDGDYLSTAYFFDFAQKMARIANILTKEEDAEHYQNLAADIKKAFNNRFYKEDVNIYDNGGQTTMSGALLLSLVPETDKGEIVANLLEEVESKNFHIDAGVVGTRWMLKATTKEGIPGIMYQIANQRDFPGWGYWMAQDATTLWQTWQGDMSLNHIMFGSIGEWFYEVAGGIRYDTQLPGFQHFILKPELTDSLDWVNCSHESVYGTIISNWEKEGENFIWKVEVPFNTTATVYLPVNEKSKIFINDKPLDEFSFLSDPLKSEKFTIVEVGSGKIRFVVTDENGG